MEGKDESFIMAYDMEEWIMICKGLNIPTYEEEWNEKHLKQISRQ